jgi:uncharacterized protein (DUF433 family)
MERNNFFTRHDEDDIRVKGTRIGIETVLEDYLEGASPEEIAARYRSLSLEQVYASITYYLHNREMIDAYLERWRNHTDKAGHDHQSSDASRRLRNIKNMQATQAGV